ncbi:MAG: amino acid adenylation domain-containing protein, partial [Rhodothermales bacterium]|nr:amino acid adenylation domain-containing protein [Rhodothermales bacterium]
MSLGSDHSDAGRGAELTQSQLLLWTGQQMHPDAPLYNMALRFEITGAVDPALFRRAFDALIERSDAFRTIVRTRRGIPFQYVLERIDFDLPVIDLSSKEDPDGSATALLADRTGETFDLGERLFDSVLLKLSADRWIWYLNQHHLVTDGWSVTVVFEALSDLYAQFAADSPGADEMLPAFADYIEFEKASRASERTESTTEYWRRKTDSLGEPPRLYGRRNQRAATGSTRTTVDLGKERSDALKQLARSDGFRSLTDHMALFNLFMTVLAALVHRVSGQKAISIGTPSHNRSTAAFRNTVGVFIEVFPFSIEIEATDTFSTLYEKVRGEASAFLRYARPGTSSSSVNRGFNVLLNYIPSSFSTFAGMPVASEWIHSGHGDSVHDLRLQVEDFDGLGRFRLHFDLNDEVFPASESYAVRRHFLRLLDGLLDDPDESLAMVDLVRLDEPHASVSGTPPVEDALASARTVVDMFNQRVSEMPDAEAVTWRETSMTYAELGRRSAVLARRLHDAGARPGSRIGMCVRRSPELPVGIMAILRSGATWVPLDPAAPRKRLDSLVDDAGIDILVVNEASRPLATGLTAHLLSIDDPTALRDGGAPEPSSPVEYVAPAGDACAYVLYTSGSTGRPKGVEISHTALAHYAAWAADYYTGGERKSFAVFTPVSFDLTITSLFVPLLSGGRMVLFPETSSPADVLEHVVADPRVEIAKLTPSHLRLLAGRTFPESGIDTLIVGGEDLKTSLGRATLDAFGGGVRVFNEYGPTEATVGCTVHRFDPDTDTGVSVPIGRPVGDAHILVVNRAGRIQPTGVEGEICVGGPGVARGYLGRPDLTGERFVDDPRRPGRKMYRTGDRGRIRTDGVLEFLGRMDEQIKIRGVRIEPGEVEHALETHPDVHDAVVVAKSPSMDGVDTGVYCVRCGLPDNYPGAAFDPDGLCHLCTGFDAYERKAREYFRSMDELGALFDRVRAERTADYDCLMLLSGGKDSTYALCRLVDMGLDVLAFTLDNGFISEGAKANIRRVVETLGVDHVFGKTPAMNEIFRDSLERYSNVCNGCFKTIYTL